MREQWSINNIADLSECHELDRHSAMISRQFMITTFRQGMRWSYKKQKYLAENGRLVFAY